MPKASDLKKGEVIEIDGTPHVVKQLAAKSPSSRGASTLYKVRFDNLLTGQTRNETYKGDDLLKEADCQKMQVQFSYTDGTQYIFMDMENYSQHALGLDSMEGQLEYLTEGLEGITALLVDGMIVAVELPQSIVMEVIETPPAIKRASASARTKPATLTTGLVVQVPEYVEQGEKVKINTANGKFMSRG